MSLLYKIDHFTLKIKENVLVSIIYLKINLINLQSSNNIRHLSQSNNYLTQTTMSEDLTTSFLEI